MVKLHDAGAGIASLAAAGRWLVTGGTDGTLKVFGSPGLRIVAWLEVGYKICFSAKL